MNSNDSEDKKKPAAERRRSETDRRQLKNYAWLDRMERRKSRDDRRSGPEYRKKDKNKK